MVNELRYMGDSNPSLATRGCTLCCRRPGCGGAT